MQNTNNFLKLIIAIIMFFSFSNISLAQDNDPSFKFNLFSVKNLFVSDILNMDEKFSEKNNVPILAPFTIKVPRVDGVTRLLEYGDRPNSKILKINFVTGGNDVSIDQRQLIENVQFIPFTLDMADHEERMTTLSNLIINDAFVSAVKSFGQKEYIGARREKLGSIEIIDAVGKYIDVNLGLIYIRVTGFLNPNSEHGVFAISNIVANKYDITNLDQLFLTNSGKTIESFEYLSE